MDVCRNVTVTVLYNDTAMHSLPVALNLLANAIYSKGEKKFFGEFKIL
jgi:hypothetical protein